MEISLHVIIPRSASDDQSIVCINTVKEFRACSSSFIIATELLESLQLVFSDSHWSLRTELRQPRETKYYKERKRTHSQEKTCSETVCISVAFSFWWCHKTDAVLLQLELLKNKATKKIVFHNMYCYILLRQTLTHRLRVDLFVSERICWR